MTTSGGLGEAETAGVILNVIPREGAQHLQRPVQRQRRERRDAGQQLHAGAEGRGPAVALRALSRCTTSTRWAAAGSSGTSSGSTAPSADRVGADGPGHVVEQERRQPECMDGRISTRAGRHSTTPSSGRGPSGLTWQATPRNKFNIHWSEQYNEREHDQGGRHRDDDTRSAGPELYQPSRQPHATWSSPVSSRLLMEAGWGMYQARYPHGAPRDDGTHNPLMIQVHEQGGEIPGLTYRFPGPGTGGGFYQSLIGTLANLRASVVVCHRRAQHEVRLPGRVQQSDPGHYWYYDTVINIRFSNGVPNRLHADRRRPRTASSTCAT